MIRIAIVDDHAMVRAGLRQFFADQPDFAVVAEAVNGREALDIVRQGAGARSAGVDLEWLCRGALRHHLAAPRRQRLPQQGL
jgi:DNA-binding LytR/AlgR family response regulator